MASKPNADTSQLSNEEIARHGLQGAKRPPGKSPGGVLHQRSTPGTMNAGKYPVALMGILVVSGIASYVYWRNKHPDPAGQAGTHSPNVQRDTELANK